MSPWVFVLILSAGFLRKQSVCVYVYNSDSDAVSVTGTPQTTSTAFNSLQCKCVAVYKTYISHTSGHAFFHF